jgi:hypothetical protein
MAFSGVELKEGLPSILADTLYGFGGHESVSIKNFTA